MAEGIVKFFQQEKGWGAITSPELPDEHDAWVHYSEIQGSGYRMLAPGDRVEFDVTTARQDSFHFVATRVRRLGPGPAPTLRRIDGVVRIMPDSTPDTPLSLRSPRPSSGSEHSRPGSVEA